MYFNYRFLLKLDSTIGAYVRGTAVKFLDLVFFFFFFFFFFEGGGWWKSIESLLKDILRERSYGEPLSIYARFAGMKI